LSEEILGYMLICWNSEEVHGQRKVRKLCPRLSSNNISFWNEIPNSLWFTSCLKAWFFWDGPPRQEQDPAAMTVILCNGSALLC